MKKRGKPKKQKNFMEKNMKNFRFWTLSALSNNIPKSRGSCLNDEWRGTKKNRKKPLKDILGIENGRGSTQLWKNIILRWS